MAPNPPAGTVAALPPAALAAAAALGPVIGIAPAGVGPVVPAAAEPEPVAPPSPSPAVAAPTAPAAAATTPTTPFATPTTAPPSPGEATLVAVNPDGQSFGPPGVGLAISGTGYRDCTSVYVFFDGVRVGTLHPDATGVIAGGGLSVPGDTGAGTHQVTTTCKASGGAPMATTTFVVSSSSSHRTAFVTSLNQPRQVAVSFKSLLISAGLAVLFLLLLAFPSELFNSTLEENYDEVRGWFGLSPREVGTVPRSRVDAKFFLFIVVGGVAYSLLSPGFGLNTSTLALVTGMTVALFIMAVVFCLPADMMIHGRFGEWGSLNILPGSIVVAFVCVGLSRMLNFQPGYLYGVLAGLAFRARLDATGEGQATAANWVVGLGVSVLAWVARVPVSSAAAKPHASAWLFGLESCLVAIFLIGIESLVVAMLPMRFLDGRKVMTWSRVLWGVLLTLGLFAVVDVLLTPGSGYVGNTTSAVRWSVALLYLAFGLFSFAFWGYFRFRPATWAPSEEEEITEFEGR